MDTIHKHHRDSSTGPLPDPVRRQPESHGLSLVLGSRAESGGLASGRSSQSDSGPCLGLPGRVSGCPGLISRGQASQSEAPSLVRGPAESRVSLSLQVFSGRPSQALV